MRRRPPLARSLARVDAWGPFVTSVAAACALGPGEATAQVRADREAPTQRLATDPDRSAWDVALSVDALGPLFGRYGAQFEIAPARWGSLTLGAAWRADGTTTAGELTLGVRLWPLAEGLEGPYLGPTLVAAHREATVAWSANVELGWQFVWDGWVVAAGGRCGWDGGQHGEAPAIALGARLALGRAWR